MSRRSPGGGAELLTIYWRDIPAQVSAGSRRDKHKALLPARFQHAIDRAAAVAGLTDTDSYVNEWRRVSRPADGDPAAAAAAEAARLDAEYPTERIESLVANGGVDAQQHADTATSTRGHQ